jgi:hypothetical protein
MLLNEINNYLKKSSEDSVFKINIEENGGYLKFSNSGQRGDRKCRYKRKNTLLF